jgi:hypothetical protein
VYRTAFWGASAPEDKIEMERERQRDWKDGSFVKTDKTSTEASRDEPKALEK